MFSSFERRKRGRGWIFAAVALAVVIAAAAFWHSQRNKPVDVRDVACLLPENTALLVVADDMELLAPTIPGILGLLDPATLPPQAGQLARERLWAAASIGTADPDLAVHLLFLPEDRVPTKLAARTPAVTTRTHRGLMIVAWSQTEHADEVAVLEQLVTQERATSLAADEGFTDVHRALGTGSGQLRVFGRTRALMQLFSLGDVEQLTTAAVERSGLDVWGLAIELEQQGLVARLVTTGNERRVERMGRTQPSTEIDFSEQVPGKPTMALRWRTDVPQLVDDLSRFPILSIGLSAAKNRMRRKHGLLLEQDVLDTLAGDGGCVWIVDDSLPGAEPSAAAGVQLLGPIQTEWVHTPGVPTRSIGWARVDDELSMRANLERLAEIGGRTSRDGWYPGREGALGLRGDHLVALSDLESSETIGQGSFLDQLPPRVAKRFRSAPPLYAYWDIPVRLDEPDPLNPVDAALNETYGHLAYADLLTDLDGGSVVRTMGLYTDGAPALEVFTEIAELMPIARAHESITHDLEHLAGELAVTTHRRKGTTPAADLECGSIEQAKRDAASVMSWEEERCWLELGREDERWAIGGIWISSEGGTVAVKGLVDADGDGVPAHYSLQLRSMGRWGLRVADDVERLTPDEVW